MSLNMSGQISALLLTAFVPLQTMIGLHIGRVPERISYNFLKLTKSDGQMLKN